MASPHRMFHSFPTRRSSDLSTHEPNGAYGITVGGDGAVWWAEDLADRMVRVDPVTGKVEEFKIPFEDRKSTRLNSSHANISYAVFCLKKKTISNWDEARVTA